MVDRRYLWCTGYIFGEQKRGVVNRRCVLYRSNVCSIGKIVVKIKMCREQERSVVKRRNVC